VEYAHPEPHCLAGDAGKLAAPALDVREPGAQLPPPERLAQLVSVAPCTPDEVRCGARSCAATAFAGAAAQWELLVSLPLEPVAAAAQRAARPKQELLIVPREASPPADGRDAVALASPAG